MLLPNWSQLCESGNNRTKMLPSIAILSTFNKTATECELSKNQPIDPPTGRVDKRGMLVASSKMILPTKASQEVRKRGRDLKTDPK
jgi:hypothetical protein